MHRRVAAASLIAAALLAAPPARPEPGHRYAPIASGLARSEHAPFLAGECGACHRVEAGRPGPLVKTVPSLCLDCHDDFATRLPKGRTHGTPPVNCGACHTPHNSEKANLLL